MEGLLGPILLLLIVLAGLSMIVGGPGGTRKLFGTLFAPFGCLLKAALGLVAVLVVGSVLWNSLLSPMQKHIPPVEPPGGTGRDVLLDAYVPLNQNDLSIYSSEQFARTPDGNFLIYQQACLATVYLMLTRAHHDRTAVIGPAQYSVGDGALAPRGFTFERKSYFESREVMDEIDAGRPVILYATLDGPLKSHFVLAVGHSAQRDALTINDPMTGGRSRLNALGPNPSIPGLRGSAVTGMRLVRW